MSLVQFPFPHHCEPGSSPPSSILSHFLPHQHLTSPLDFQNEHPGGAKILKRVAGKDATKQFWKYHNDSVLKKYGEKLKVGTVKEAPKL